MCWRTEPPRLRGFTLLELAISLTLLALLLGGLTSSLLARLESSNNSDKTLALVQEALIGFALANGRLPRPARSSSDGQERSSCANDSECTGFLPWESLAMPRCDGWGKLFRYSVSREFSGDSATPLSLASLGNKTVKSREGNTLINLASQVPAVILSHGRSQHGTLCDGSPVGDSSTSNLDEDSNASSTSTFYARLHSPNPATPGGEFDDDLSWLSAPLLLSRLVAAGRLP